MAAVEVVLPQAWRRRAWVDQATSPQVGSAYTPCARNTPTSKAAPSTPAKLRRRSYGGPLDPVRVLSMGSGGVEELQQKLEDRMVSWALLRFQVGGGAFVRTKMVAVHFNGANAPVMLRGWLNARGPEVVFSLGEVHATVEITSRKDLTLEFLCERLLRIFATDNMDYSLQALRNDYSQMVKRTEEAALRKLESEAAAALVQKIPAFTPPSIEVAPEPDGQIVEEHVIHDLECSPDVPTSLRTPEALSCVSADNGALNWLLLEPDRLEVHKTGQGGLEEMKEHFVEDLVLFGLLRLTFGSGTSATGRSAPCITKHVFVHWVGPRVSIVRRGKWNACSGKAAALIGKSCAVTFRKQAHSLKDIQLEDVVSELRRFAVVDGVAATGGVASNRISVEEYRNALAEEIRHRQAAEVMERKKRRQSLLEQKAEAIERRRESLAKSVEVPVPAPEEPKEEVQKSWSAGQPPLVLEVDEAEEEKPAFIDIRSALRSAHDPSGSVNWVLFGWPEAPISLLRAPPSPCRARG